MPSFLEVPFSLTCASRALIHCTQVQGMMVDYDVVPVVADLSSPSPQFDTPAEGGIVEESVPVTLALGPCISVVPCPVQFLHRPSSTIWAHGTRSISKACFQQAKARSLPPRITLHSVVCWTLADDAGQFVQRREPALLCEGAVQSRVSFGQRGKNCLATRG